jgi:hypothetical protein
MQLSKVFVILIMSFCFEMITDAQSFYKVISTVGNDYASSVINDLDSGFVIVGATEGIGQGGMDGYLLKLDTAGNLIYTRTFGGQEIDWLTDIKAIPTGFIISGYSNSFGPDYDAYIVQTDFQGVTTWETTVGGSSWDFANAIALMPDGNYLMAGESYSFSNGNADGFIAKIDTNGDTLWTKHFGGSKKDWFNDVAVNDYGEIALCGVTTNSYDETDFWLMKLDDAGNLLWELALGDTLNDEGTSISYLSNGDIVATGYNTFDDANKMVAYHYKLDSAGGIKFLEGFFGPNDDSGNAITNYVDTDQSIVAIASSSYGFGGIDVYVDELSELMLPTFNKHYSFGTQYHEIPQSIDTTFDKGVVVVGNTNYSSIGSNNIFINKTDSSANYTNIYQEEVDLLMNDITNPVYNIWPNPSSGTIYSSSLQNDNFKVYSLSGVLVNSGRFNSGSVTLSLESGLYILDIQNKGVCKIVIE